MIQALNWCRKRRHKNTMLMIINPTQNGNRMIRFSYELIQGTISAIWGLEFEFQKIKSGWNLIKRVYPFIIWLLPDLTNAFTWQNFIEIFSFFSMIRIAQMVDIQFAMKSFVRDWLWVFYITKFKFRGWRYGFSTSDDVLK